MISGFWTSVNVQVLRSNCGEAINRTCAGLHHAESILLAEAGEGFCELHGRRKAIVVPRSLSPVQETFKQVMAHIATPVAVVTSIDEGLPFGTTVSAFTSLSMHPPMVLVALDSGSQTLEAIAASVRFGLNVLASGQHTTALNFAKKSGVDKFNCVQWEIDHDLPRIAGASGWIACTVEKFVEGGDHWIVVGNVVAADKAVGDPLTYHRRVFGTHSALGQLKS